MAIGIDTATYRKLAMRVNNRNPQTGFTEGFICQRSENSKGFFASGPGNRDGFQAAVYETVGEDGATTKVLAIAGTQTFALNDYTADARIGLHVVPNQASSAYKFYQSAIHPGDRVVIVGHSLGGALAQVLGYWTSQPFVTFNAPGMARVIGAAQWNFLKPDVWRRTRAATRLRASPNSTPARGVNFLIDGDLIGRFGKHIGDVFLLKSSNPSLFQNHVKMDPIIASLFVGEACVANVDPFTLDVGTAFARGQPTESSEG